MSSYSNRVKALQEDSDHLLRKWGFSRSFEKKVFRVVLIVTDGLALGAAFWLAFWIRFDLRLALRPEVEPSLGFYTQLATVMIPVWLVLFGFFGLYRWENLLGGTAEYARIFNTCTTGMMLVVAAAFIEPGFVVARGWLLFAWVLSILLVGASRFMLRRAVYALRDKGYFLAPAVVVGVNSEALALCRQLRNSRSSGLRILGFANGENPEISPEIKELGLAVLGSLRDLEIIVRQHGVEEVIVAVTALDRDELIGLYETLIGLPGVRLRLSSGLYEILTTGVEVKTLGFVPLMSLSRLRLDPVQYFAKTALDYALTTIGLLIASPLLAILCLLVKWDSPGPILHRRRVLGVGGREFDAFKFRTMHENGEDILRRHPELAEQLDRDQKLKDDPRVTRLGRRLRRYSLDELPQLFNVLLGQMSLVGPRMITPEEGEKYGKHRMNLLTVKPGITGLWQVSGRSDISYEDRVRIDMHYIRNYTIWRDLQILLVQTPGAVLKGKGAY